MLRYILIIILLMSYAMEGIAVEKNILLASSEYPPYFGAKLKNHGFISEIIVEAFKRVEYNVKIEFVPWKRAENGAKKGKYDGMIALWYRKQREEWFVYSAPLPSNIIGFYKRKGEQIDFNGDYENLRSYKIGTVRGYGNPAEFEKANLKTQEVTTDKQNLGKLALQRIEALSEPVIDRRK